MDAGAADELVARLRAGPTLFLMHVNADPDCVGSAHALQRAFGGRVGAPDGLSKDGRRLAERLGLDVDEWPHPENFATVVAVDTSSRSQLGRLGPRVAAPLLVDHHRYGDLLEAAPAHAWDPARASCAEVVLALLERIGRPPDEAAAFGLFVGLFTDTARFRFADAAAHRAAARLMELSGARFEDVERLLDPDDEEEADSLPRRLATLKGAQRATVDALGGFAVATSHVSAFDAAAAASLVRAGADVALVASERTQAARVSLRAGSRALAHGLHLGELANRAAREVGWSGGGHEGAAGLSGKPPVAPAQAALLRLLRETLQQPKGTTVPEEAR